MDQALLARSPPWLKWAAGELGVSEAADNARVLEYRALGKIQGIGHEREPWCAIFVNAAVEESGLPGTRSASSQSFRYSADFIQLRGSALGAICVDWRGSNPHSGIGHAGFYVGETMDHASIYTLGGNEGRQVQIEPLAKHSPNFGLIGFWWPKSVALPRIEVITVPAHAPAHQVSVD